MSGGERPAPTCKGNARLAPAAFNFSPGNLYAFYASGNNQLAGAVKKLAADHQSLPFIELHISSTTWSSKPSIAAMVDDFARKLFA